MTATNRYTTTFPLVCNVLRRTATYIILCSVVVSGCGAPDPALPPPPEEDTEASVERGHALVTGFGACGFCHSGNGQTGAVLSGGRMLRDSYGEVAGPNITLSESGIGDWTEQQLKALLRTNTRPDGSELGGERHRGFEWLADRDITAITAYLRTLAPTENRVEPRRISFLARNTTGFLDAKIVVRGYIPSLSPSFKAEYGQYVVDHVARCGSCHSKPGGLITSEEYLAGGQEISFDGEYKLAPNITSSTSAGIGSWGEGAIRDFLRSGRTPEGREVDSRFCPVQFYARAPAEQVDAVVAYLRSVPAVN
jgi:mono/diheme cytochrome c family protein